MNFIQTIIIDIILLLFPLLLYLFYIVYNKNINKKLNAFCFDFALLTSLYAVICYGVGKVHLILDIPLILAYFKKSKLSIFLLSIILIMYRFSLGYYLPLLFLEYLIYYMVYRFYNRKNSNSFVIEFLIIKTLFVSINIIIHGNVLEHYFILLIFYLLTFIVVFLSKKAEDIIKLHMSVKELEKNKQLQDSLFKISHEIRNPIAVCKTYLDMYDNKNEKHIKYIPIVKEEINKVLLLLQDFLTMSKINITKDILDINMLLEEIVANFKPILDNKKIIFETNISEDEIYINGDYNRLNQVFTNIITNGIEAINKNGLIKIYTKIEAENIKIYIEDNGMGINSEDLEKITEPFWTTKESGTGLGVALSSEIIKAHNGEMKYNSELNEGTLVEIILPLYLRF